MKERSPTLQSLAEQAGVSKATVSNALNGRGRMSDRKRAEIRRLAEEAGYRPNLALAALAAKRFKTMAPGELAWVAVLTRGAYVSREDRRFGPAYGEHGFSVEIVDTLMHGDAGKLSRRLYQQGVQAVIIHRCLKDVGYFDGFDFRPFVVLSFDQSFSARFPHFNLMRISRMVIFFDLWERMRQCGYRRIGVVLYRHPPTEVRIGNERVLAALARCQERTEEADRVPLLFFESFEEEAIKRVAGEMPAWVERHRPDVLLLFGPALLTAAESIGLPYAFLTNAQGRSSGYTSGEAEFSEQAASLLETMIRAGSRGPREHSFEVIVRPEWHEGESLMRG